MLDLLYPPACHFCDTPLEDGNYVCDSCEETLLPVEPPFCSTCGEPFEGNIGADFQCPNCHKLSFDFDFARAALQNTENAHKLVLDLKYGKQLHLAPTLAKYCAHLIRSTPEIHSLPDAVLVPVPLHWRRKLKRSFNQAEQIARHVAKDLKLPMAHPLKRTRHTTTQTKLSRKKRLENLSDAFSFTQLSPKYRTAIIIDDVLTTGATAHACASTLREHVPHLQNIIVVTALRG